VITAVPTLSTWGILAAALLILGSGLALVRNRQRRRR
jgi:LPXTG-motif cell wall-anchored protein